jgi:hypothetical protein
MLPWVWIPLALLFIAAVRRGPRDSSRWLLMCLGGGPIIAFTLVALGGKPGLPHWPAPGWFLVVPLLGDALSRLEGRGTEWARGVRIYLGGSAVVVVLLVSLAAAQITSGWLSERSPGLFVRGDPSLEALDWRESLGALDQAPRGRRPTLIVTDSWIDAAKLGAALAPRATVLCFSDDPRQFQFVADQRTFVGEDALVVFRTDVKSDLDSARPRRMASYFRSLDSVGTIQIRRGKQKAGREVIRLTLYRGTSLLRPYATSGVR